MRSSSCRSPISALAGALLAQGSLAGALENYRAGLALRERIAPADPDNTRWQRELITLNNEIGNTLLTQGPLAEAQASYRKGEAIATRLASSDPKNAQWQRDLTISQMGIADVERDAGRLDGALAGYQAGLDGGRAAGRRRPPQHHVAARSVALVRPHRHGAGTGMDQARRGLRELSQESRDHAASRQVRSRQHGLATRPGAGDQRVGDLLVAHQEFAEAMNAFDTGLAISKDLNAADTDQQPLAARRRELPSAHERGFREARGHLAMVDRGVTLHRVVDARSAGRCRSGQPAVAERVLGHAEQHGRGPVAQGNQPSDAFVTYRASLATAGRVATANPDNVQWQLNVAMSHLNLGGRGR